MGLSMFLHVPIFPLLSLKKIPTKVIDSKISTIAPKGRSSPKSISISKMKNEKNVVKKNPNSVLNRQANDSPPPTSRTRNILP